MRGFVSLSLNFGLDAILSYFIFSIFCFYCLTERNEVINLRAKNLVAEHSEGITISYRFQQTRMIIEPLMLVTSFLAFFVVCILLVRIDATTIGTTTITKEKVN